MKPNLLKFCVLSLFVNFGKWGGMLCIDIDYRVSDHTHSKHVQMMRVDYLAAEVVPGYKQTVRCCGNCGAWDILNIL